MIQDKDFVMRQVRQLSNLLSKLLLGKKEKDFEDLEEVLDTQSNDILGFYFDELSDLSIDEVLAEIHQRDKKYHHDLYELMGHIFYYKFKVKGEGTQNKKAKFFYEIWLKETQIYALTILNRIQELN